MTFREDDLKFGKIRGIEGNKIVVRASILECLHNNTTMLVEVGVFVNCGGCDLNLMYYITPYLLNLSHI
jgi:hypothetical protein